MGVLLWECFLRRSSIDFMMFLEEVALLCLQESCEVCVPLTALHILEKMIEIRFPFASTDSIFIMIFQNNLKFSFTLRR